MKRQVLIVLAVLVLCAGLGFSVRRYLRHASDPASVPPGPAAEANEPGPLYSLAAPPLRLREVRWDFGSATPGKKLNHRLEINNPTAEPWTLRRVTSGCSCTVSELPSKTVRPGETAWLEVAYRAPAHDSRVSGYVVIEFAEPASPIIHLVIEGEVRSLLSVEPASLVFDYSPSGTRLSQIVKLRSHADHRVEIVHVDGPEWLRAEVRPADDARTGGRPRQAWELVVRVEPGKVQAGPPTSTLVVHTDSEQVGPAHIPVRLQLPLEASPDRLDFGTVQLGKASLKNVLLRAVPELGELAAKDLVVTHDLGDEVDVQVEGEGVPRRFVLVVGFQPKRPRGKLEGELEITTRKGMVPPVRVKVSGKAAGPD